MSEMLWNQKQVISLPHKTKTLTTALKKCIKSTSKLFTTNYFSRKLKNFSRIFCPELSEETLVHFYLTLYPIELTVSAVLIF